jgi:putative membrane protein
MAMMWWYDGGPGWSYWLMPLSMIVVTALLIVGAVLAIRYLSRAAPRGAGGVTPEQVLDDRFARGEIGEREYRDRLHTLRTGHESDDVPR